MTGQMTTIHSASRAAFEASAALYLKVAGAITELALELPWLSLGAALIYQISGVRLLDCVTPSGNAFTTTSVKGTMLTGSLPINSILYEVTE